jgi:hypothetical protein
MRDRVSEYLIFPLMQTLNGGIEVFKLFSPNVAVQLLTYLSHSGITIVRQSRNRAIRDPTGKGCHGL